ncbi:hypothetical protein F5887DRAFT_1282634 [Amanita rubescens]|nr:hypothetical protein F5887DRAFT_1282634 [Amanita rubescens]
MNASFNHSTFNEIHGNYVTELLEKFKKWLNAPDPSINHNNIRKKHYKGTGQWLLGDERYVAWKEQSNSFLWINGISGCGKTIICSTVIEDLKAIVKNQPEIGFAYFYFDINDSAKQTSRGLLSSLVLSLTAKSKDYSLLERLYKEHDQLHKPTEDELLHLFMKLLQCFKQVYVAIDALDECDGYDQLFDQVIKVIHGWQLPHFHLLASSRREQHINATIGEFTPTEICLSAELVQNDIIYYVYSVVGKDHRLKRWDHTIQEHVKNALISGAKGMFRWVACQFEELKHCPNEKVLMDTLKSLPKNLGAIYDQILQRIDEREMSSAKVILQWLILGKQPLTTEELAVVLTFDPSTGSFDPRLQLPDLDDIIQLCSSLVIKTYGDRVQLAHASVKEYFLCNTWKIGLPDAQSGHTSISHCCLRDLLQNARPWDQLFVDTRHFPLLHYSVRYWIDHYKLSNKNEILQGIVTTFFLNEDGTFGRWIDCYKQFDKVNEIPLYDYERWMKDNKKFDTVNQTGFGKKISPLHYVILLGLQDIMEDLLIRYPWFLACNENLYVAAAMGGDSDIMKFFLDIGTNVNKEDNCVGNALEVAIVKGYVEIVRLLLNRPRANVNAQGVEYSNSLQAAISEGHVEIARLLLDKGADVNTQSGMYGSALQAAISKGHVEIARLLLDKGLTDVNAQGGKYGNALQAAISEGHVEIARLLLDKGADVNTQGGMYGSALQAAISKGHVEIARLLLDKGADVNAQGGKYNTALQAAISMGHVEIARLLLDKGADVTNSLIST